jgi:hypothetical protein
MVNSCEPLILSNLKIIKIVVKIPSIKPSWNQIYN